MDITNLFIQTPIYRKRGKDTIIINIEGVMVDMMVHMDPEKYGPKAVYEKGKKVLYIESLKYIYSMLQSDLFSFIKMRKYLHTYGFKFNPYNPCVANNITEGKPLTLVLHVDNVTSSNKEKNVVDKF